MRTLYSIASIGTLFVGLAHAEAIQFETLAAYVHAEGSLATQLGPASAGYFSAFDVNNLGSFGWSYTNTTGTSLLNVRLLGFVDADLDRDTNTFFNEYGIFHSLALPPAAPAGAIAGSSWQIDEPGFLFGTILTDLQTGILKNTNSVPSSSPDDVSLALGFDIGTLENGQTVVLNFRIATADIGGLQQLDPESGSNFYFNGYAAVSDPVGPGSGVPEPSSFALIATGLIAVALLYRKSRAAKR